MNQSRSYGGVYGPSWTAVDQSATVASVGPGGIVHLPIDEFYYSDHQVPWASFTTINGELLLDSGFYTIMTQLEFSYAFSPCQLTLQVQSVQQWINAKDFISMSNTVATPSLTTVTGFIDVNDPLSFIVHVLIGSSVTELQGIVTILKHA